MVRIRHFITVMLLAVFAAGTVAYSAAATEMAVTMAIADTDKIGMDMPHCLVCDEDSAADMAACDMACTVPLVADLIGGVALPRTRMRPQHETSASRDLPGRTSEPSLDPPRTLI